MTDLDPDIWKNPTLGAAGAGPFLPELEAQAFEDANARRENREPLIAEYPHRYPKFMEPNSIPTQVASSEIVFKTAEEIASERGPVEVTGPIENEGEGEFKLPEFE